MATKITATLPTLNFPREVDYPTQEDWAAFSAAAELNFGLLGGDWSTQMQLWKTEANAMSIESNNNADIAQAVANYQGDWVSQGYTLGQTVSVSGIYYICKLTHATGQNPTTGGSIYWNLALGNWSLKVDTNMSGYTSKTTPIDADLIPLSDSIADFGIKKLSWASIKATLKSYFDGLYATPAYVDGKMVLGTAINSTSGTSIDFTGIPSWAKRISVIFDGVSTSGISAVQVQLGSDSIGVESAGYSCISNYTKAAAQITGAAYTAGFGMYILNAMASRRGAIIFEKLSLNSWIAFGNIYDSSDNSLNLIAGSKTLSSTLDRIRITTVNGTDTFDAGQINIMYEG